MYKTYVGCKLVKYYINFKVLSWLDRWYFKKRQCLEYIYRMVVSSGKCGDRENFYLLLTLS